MCVLLGDAMMQVGWRPECTWRGCRAAGGMHMCPKAPRRSFRIVVVRGGCPVRVSIEAFVSSHTSGRATMRLRDFVLKASRRFF